MRHHQPAKPTTDPDTVRAAPPGQQELQPFGLSEAPAAKRAGISPRTLQRMRLQGEGPPYVLITRKKIIYPIEELDKWLRSRLVRNTGEADRLRAGGAA